MAIKLDGKALADKICQELKEKVEREHLHPRLAIVTTGDNAASKVYVRQKVKRCEEIGIDCQVLCYDYLDYDTACDVRDEVEGRSVILQLPAEFDHTIYSAGMTVELMTDHIPVYDADGFTNWNVATLFSGEQPVCPPCTPAGIMRLLDEYQIDVAGKHVLIINRSNIVGKPLAHMMLSRDATVTVAHSKTSSWGLGASIRDADIIVEATGKPKWITPDLIDLDFHDQVLIDVTMARDENGKLCGGFDPACYNYCKAYTPVPGGVGPMTVAMLMENVVRAAE